MRVCLTMTSKKIEASDFHKEIKTLNQFTRKHICKLLRKSNVRSISITVRFTDIEIADKAFDKKKYCEQYPTVKVKLSESNMEYTKTGISFRFSIETVKDGSPIEAFVLFENLLAVYLFDSEFVLFSDISPILDDMLEQLNLEKDIEHSQSVFLSNPENAKFFKK